jgi:phage shock protein PspC (stress-responsive transcriptional regulator)
LRRSIGGIRDSADVDVLFVRLVFLFLVVVEDTVLLEKKGFLLAEYIVLVSMLSMSPISGAK